MAQHVDENTVRLTAERMAKQYAGNSYPAWERATDHAMSYDAGTPGRQFWVAVVKVLCDIKPSPGGEDKPAGSLQRSRRPRS